MLNVQKIAGIKASDVRQEFKDRDGLVLVVQPKTGAKSWVLRYKASKKTLGKYPAISLADARRMTLIRRDEMDNEKTVKQITVGEAWSAFMKDRGEKSKSGKVLKSADEKWRIFHADIESQIGSKLLAEVTRLDVAKLIDAKKSKAPIAANRLYTHMNQFWSWCVGAGYAQTELEMNVMQHIEKPASENVRERYLSDDEIKLFLANVHHAGSAANHLKTLLYTGMRLREPLRCTFGDIDGERLYVPDTKNGLDFIVYLSPTVRTFGFDAGGDADDKIFPNSLTAASKPIAKVCKAMKTVEPFSAHDLRRTMVTKLSSMRDADGRRIVTKEVIDKMINHKDRTTSGIHYDKYDYYEEKKAGWQAWSDWLDAL